MIWIKKMNLNRNGEIGTGMLYFVFFFMLALILAGIYGGLIAFFGKGYDYRRTESNDLFDSVKECVVANKFFDSKEEIPKDTFLEKCKIELKIIEDGEHLIYLKNRNGVELSVGVSDFKNRCFLNIKDRARAFPKCKTYGEDLDKKDYLLVGSSQNSRRVA